jgi:zinc transport system permease protein
MGGILSFGFMRNALAAGFLVSLACGVIGTLVVLKRMVFISGGVAHTAYGGIGLAFYFGINPVLGALAFSLGASLLMGYVQRKTRQRPDTLIGVMWAIGMAIGIIFADLTPGYKADLMSYLFGSILAVTTADLWLMLAVDLVVIGVVALFFKEMQASAFDEAFARTRNVPVDLLYLILVTMIGLAVVMLMRVVGLIMIIALLTVPAAIGALFLKSMRKIMLLGTGLSLVFTTGGLMLSYAFNLTSGATIILFAGAGYLVALLVRRLCKRCPDD